MIPLFTADLKRAYPIKIYTEHDSKIGFSSCIRYIVSLKNFEFLYKNLKDFDSKNLIM